MTNSMRPIDRERRILNWFERHPQESVDILNKEFVFDYAEATGVKVAMQMFGAPKCPQLGRDLGRMFAQGKLTRCAVGLPEGFSSMGFPKWVWVYRLSAQKKAGE